MLRRFMQKCIPTFISILVTGIRWIPQYLLISAEIQCKLQSHSQSVIPLFFSTYCTSVASLLKQWLTSGQCHKLTSQSDAPCSQLRLLRPLCRATLYIKTCDILRRRKNLGKTSQSLGEAAKGALPSDFALYKKLSNFPSYSVWETICLCVVIFQFHTRHFMGLNLWKWFVLSLPYRVVFAVATEDSVVLYDSQQTLPFAYVANIHYHTLSDLTWFVAVVQICA